MNNQDDDTSSPPSTAAQAAGEARKTAPWKRPAPIVGGRRGVAKRGSGIPRPGGQPKAAAPAPTPAPKAPAVAVAPAPAEPVSSDPKRPWWKRRPPVVGGGKRAQKPMQTSPRAPAPPRQTFDDLVDDQIVAMGRGDEVTASEPSEPPTSDLESELDDLSDLGDLA